MTGEVVIKTFFGNEPILNEKYKGKLLTTEMTEYLFEIFHLFVSRFWINMKFAILGDLGWKYLNFSNEDGTYKRFLDLKGYCEKIVLQRV